MPLDNDIKLTKNNEILIVKLTFSNQYLNVSLLTPAIQKQIRFTMI